MSTLASPQLLSEQEYLESERNSETKREYYQGEVFAMSGASHRHGIIVRNLASSLDGQLRKSGCSVITNDLKVRASQAPGYFYPDITIHCGPPEFADRHGDVLLNPVLIIEVLSPSTREYDRYFKMQCYRTIPSLRHYLLVAQDRHHIEQYQRQGDVWVLRDYESGIVRLNDPACELPFDVIYAE